MHEYSLIQSVIATCERVAAEHKADRIVKIYLTVGKMAGIEPHFLEEAFRFFREGTICEHTVMVIEEEDILAVCGDCGHRFQVINFSFACPLCQSSVVSVASGKSLQITHLEFTR